ncbi:MAG: PEP-CTERM sorting domain-containing protein, partial [Phycisphaerae bacterium]|nr:PEP-CTERM sorting domain-containing protein [Phycisphaerae bacterium]
LAVIVVAPSAHADIIGPPQPPVITGSIVEAPGLGTFIMTQPLDEYEYEADSGKYKLKGEFIQTIGDFTITIEEIEWDPDPVLAVTWAATNNSGSTQTLSISFSQPGALAGPTLVSGVASLQVLDGSSPADGATATAPTSGSVFSALIDGVVVKTLMDDPFTLSAPAGLIGQTMENFTPESGPRVDSSIGIDFSVVVSPNDLIGVMGRVDVVVPEPATVALLGLGGMFILKRRRR